MSGYSSWITSVTELMGGIVVTDATSATPTSDDDFNAIYPEAISYAEGRMYRDPDMDFLANRTTSANTSTSGGVRTQAIPSNLIILEQVNLITPAGASPTAGTRVPASFIDLSWINAVYPAESFTSAPAYGSLYYAEFNTQNITIAPTPDASYVVEFCGTFRPDALSASNPDTLLTSYIPDVFIACSMVFLSAYMKSFGSQADNPQQAQSWETQYTALKSGVAVQEARRKHLGAGASAFAPSLVVKADR